MNICEPIPSIACCYFLWMLYVHSAGYHYVSHLIRVVCDPQYRPKKRKEKKGKRNLVKLKSLCKFQSKSNNNKKWKRTNLKCEMNKISSFLFEAFVHCHFWFNFIEFRKLFERKNSKPNIKLQSQFTNKILKKVKFPKR